MVAEDEEAVRLGVTRALLHHGHEVHEAATIAQAVDVLGRLGDKLDIAVLDYFLPVGKPAGNSSRAALDRSTTSPTAEVITDMIYERRIGAAVLFITGHRPDSMRHVVRGTQAADCLYKPFTTLEFLSVFHRVERWHAERASAPRGADCRFDAPDKPIRGAFSEGLLRAVVQLAGVASDDTQNLRVLRAALLGREHHNCSAAPTAKMRSPTPVPGMSASTYKRRKRELQVVLGVANFTNDILRRLDHALASGECDWRDLLGFARKDTPPRVAQSAPGLWTFQFI